MRITDPIHILMMHSSAWSTPEGTAPQVRVIELSPLDLYETLTSMTPVDEETIPLKRPRLMSRSSRNLFKACFRCLSPVLLLIILVCWWFDRGQWKGLEQKGPMPPSQFNLKGLRFVDAIHPGLRVCSFPFSVILLELR